MNIETMIENYIQLGYKKIEASSKVGQDILLHKIAKSNFKNNITIKGGVVMHNISKDIRRATRDLDLDFIKYSLSNDSIREFIKKLNMVGDGITIIINGDIEKLHHQDYDGKRVNILIKDNFNNIIETKLDIGVNKLFELEQEKLYFDLGILHEEISLLVNSKEQSFAEKLKSLLKFGIRSTRYKDIFDFYYLINNTNLNKNKLVKCLNKLIIDDEQMKEKSIFDIITRFKNISNNNDYKKMLEQANNNWIEKPINEVIDLVLNFIISLSTEYITI